MKQRLSSHISRRLLAALFGVVALAFLACGSDTTDINESGYPVLPTDDLVQVGQPLYQQNCASCHGDSDTRPPVPFAPPHTDEGHTWHHPDRNLVDWILDGVPLATAMPEFRGQLSEEEVRAVVAYIKTFWPSRIQNQQIEGSQQFEEAFGNQ